MFDTIKTIIGIVLVIIIIAVILFYLWSLCYCLTEHSDFIVLTESGAFRYLKQNAPIANY